MVLELAARGHSVGIHPFVGPQTQAVTSEVAERFAALYGVGPRIVRNHHVTWLPVGEAASVQGRAGLRLGLDYIAQSTQGADLGFMGGTGVPMTYPATPVLHLPTQLDDHVLLPARFGYRPYDAEQLVQKSASVLDVAARHGSVIVANHHPIWWIETDGAWQRGLIGAARERSIPIWGAARYLRYAHGYREPVLWRSAQGWMALVPETGLTVVLGGERYALRPGVHKVAHQK